MQKLVVFSGAGISAESGLRTFRDSDGLWEEYRVEDVATPEAWDSDPELVQHFYNLRRKQIMEATPNAAHIALADLESRFDTTIITQNIDDLHERAGCKNVLHLHGEIMKARSTEDPDLLYELNDWELKIGNKNQQGHQLRPHVVWFGEAVPMIPIAQSVIAQAEILIIVGTSLNVYPAAGLIHYAPSHSLKYLVDPGDLRLPDINNLTVLREKAGTGVPMVVKALLN
ncbi:MAG: NAD-dependent deacetylase [Salibacteraceae bacterium]